MVESAAERAKPFGHPSPPVQAHVSVDAMRTVQDESRAR